MSVDYKFRVGVITASDKGAKGEREDLSGAVIKDIVKEWGYLVTSYCMLPDEQKELEKEMIRLTDEDICDLILTTGGTGFSVRDVTPEATISVSERMVPGIPEAIRTYSMTLTKRAMLSRGAAGIRKNALIVNLPGSPKAVKESLGYIMSELEHGLMILKGVTGECAGKD
ncbi:MAG: MogA/MoaB family molybdenum cofactor biosynthesis protein [Anaerocolumna sp.]